MADILNRLLLNTSNFDANLSKSKRGVEDYQNGISGLAKKAGAGMLAFAGTIGIAVGASEMFNETINSSQATGDAWAKMQDQMKASVDSFFASIAMGNFDGFLSNLQNVINKSGELSVILDNLATKTLFNNSEVNDLNTKYQIELNLAKSRNISDKERNEHLSKARGYLAEMAKLQVSLSSANYDASYSTLQADMAKQGFNRNVAKETWDYLLKDSNRSDIDTKAEKFKSAISGYEDKISKSKKFNQFTGNWENTQETRRLMSELDSFKKSKSAIFGHMASVFVQLRDDGNSEVAKAINMRSTANNLKVSVSQKDLEIANTEAKINGSYNKQNTQDLAASGSIAKINEELTGLNKKLVEATTVQARIAVQTTINELEAKKISLQIEIDKGIFEKDYGVNKLQNVSMSESKGNFLNKSTDISKIKLPKYKPMFSNKDVATNIDYIESLYTIGDAMHSISGFMNEGAAAWLNWGASILSSVAEAIPAIRSIIPALQAKATGEAIAGSASSGPLGWITAGAAALAIAAAFSGIPAFAGGGTVKGFGTMGDNNIIRVNSGEMILNREQQSNLFRLLDGGGIHSGEMNGEVVFKINGSVIEGVLKNRSAQKSKVR